MLLVVVEVAAAGLTIAGAGAVTVGALAVPVCGAAVACCLVHSSYCTILHARVSTCVDAWLVGCPARLGACLPVSVRGLGGCVRSVLWARGGRLRALGGRGVFPRFAPTRGLWVGWGYGGYSLALGAVRPLVR